ncbi:STAS domain-containing protein [Streptomyces sp. NPDC050856]|uniref:STAS domain-containing protein n=1 Tax=unclassified Streptomyces TaxID=2593676 RepID=UPI0033D56A07
MDERPHSTLVVDRTAHPRGVRVSGEVYLDTRAEWDHALHRLALRDEDIHMDLTGLTFVDVAGATSLAHAARNLPAGRRIVVRNPPPSLSRALDLFWPGLTAIEVAR